VPIKLTDINIKEFERFKNDANVFINEHLLTSYIASKCFNEFYNLDENLDSFIEEVSSFYRETFLWHLSISGFDISEFENKEFKSTKEYFKLMVKLMDKVFIECKKFWVNLAVNPEEKSSYKGALCNYLDFLLPILTEIKKLSFMPNKAIYLLIDDAGYLNLTQTKILNTWVSYRTSSEVCLKISTQIDYKSFKTISDKTIDSPHDYSEVNIADIYTTSTNDYYKRVDEIVKKRLKKFLDKEISSENFFPVNKEQQLKIDKIKEDLKIKFANEEKKHAAGDASRRYATSEYYKQISGNSITYSYAGFENLVAISSGIIRHFLEPASNMYAIHSKGQNENIDFIPDSIQNLEINEYSKRFLEEEFSKIFEEHGNKNNGERFSKADKLYNLIQGLGQVFRKIYMSNRTERIVFSVALNNLPDTELSEILDLAIQYGYLHKGTIGNKQGTGRNKLYILSRTLAPFFRLDPTGFRGYRFMSSEQLKLSLINPKKFVDEVTKSIDNESDTPVPTLFDNLDT
jgi:hypothetical protein